MKYRTGNCMKRVALVALAAFAVCALPASAETFYLLGPSWQSGEGLVLKVDSTSVTNQSFQQAIARAEQSWSASPDVDMIPASRAKVVIQVADGICVFGALACTNYRARNGHFTSVTITVPPGVLASNGQHVLDALACHELGHALGLNHQPTQDTCLYPSISTTYPAEVPNQVDFAELAYLYG